jgi:nucleoside-diphosphate-sugar epimerase
LWRPLLADVDGVVHAAAIAHVGPDVPTARYKAVNCDAAAVLAQAAADKRFVFISSIRAQVGPSSPDIQTEQTVACPTEAYGETKLAAEAGIRAVHAGATVFRPAVVIGPVPNGNVRFMARLARLPFPLPLAGLQAPQAMVALDNLATAVIQALGDSRLSGETFVVADEPHPTLATAIAWIRSGQGRAPGLFILPDAVLKLPLALIGKSAVFDRMTAGMLVDASRLRSAGWTPRVSLQSVFEQIGRDSLG